MTFPIPPVYVPNQGNLPSLTIKYYPGSGLRTGNKDTFSLSNFQRLESVVVDIPDGETIIMEATHWYPKKGKVKGRNYEYIQKYFNQLKKFIPKGWKFVLVDSNHTDFFYFSATNTYGTNLVLQDVFTNKGDWLPFHLRKRICNWIGINHQSLWFSVPYFHKEGSPRYRDSLEILSTHFNVHLNYSYSRLSRLEPRAIIPYGLVTKMMCILPPIRGTPADRTHKETPRWEALRLPYLVVDQVSGINWADVGFDPETNKYRQKVGYSVVDLRKKTKPRKVVVRRTTPVTPLERIPFW